MHTRMQWCVEMHLNYFDSQKDRKKLKKFEKVRKKLKKIENDGKSLKKIGKDSNLNSVFTS